MARATMMLVSSNTLLRRLCTWVRVCTKATRVRGRSRTACTAGGVAQRGAIRPGAKRAASQAASAVSVFFPGRRRTARALATITSRVSTQTWEIGFPYTPVLSSTAMGQPCALRQVRQAPSGSDVVPTSRHAVWMVPSSWTRRRHAVHCAGWPSIPPHTGWTTGMTFISERVTMSRERTAGLRL
jgi:hypothetical protein